MEGENVDNCSKKEKYIRQRLLICRSFAHIASTTMGRAQERAYKFMACIKDAIVCLSCHN